MLETDLQAWRQQIHELFYEARTELKSIMSELDEMVALERTARRDRETAMAPTPITHHELPGGPSIAATKGSDFSLRLDFLKRKLNERLQERSPSDANSSNSLNQSMQPADPARAEKP